MKKPNVPVICNIVAVVLLLLLLGTQLLPFWTCEDCKTHEEPKEVSVGEYVWVPEDHSPITKGMTSVYLEKYGKDYKDEFGKKFKFQPNDVVFPHVIILVASVLSVLLLIKVPVSAVASFLPLVAGVSGIWGYLSNLALHQGQNWQLHLVVSCIVAAAALASIVLQIVLKLKKPAKV